MIHCVCVEVLIGQAFFWPVACFNGDALGNIFISYLLLIAVFVPVLQILTMMNHYK